MNLLFIASKRNRHYIDTANLKIIVGGEVNFELKLNSITFYYDIIPINDA